METTIEVAGLRKRFGRTLALDGMTFTVPPGQVTGYIGPNAAEIHHDAGNPWPGRPPAATVLANTGAEVDVTGPGMLTIAGLPAERAVVLLSGHAIPFSEVTAHRATLEEAYLELTRDAVEFQSGQAAS